MRIALPLALAVFLAGCIDLEGAYADCVDAGRCVDAGIDAGADHMPDAGLPDAGDVDAGLVDAGQADAGEADAGAPDAGEPDAGQPDAGVPDAGVPDAGVDAGVPDAGASCPGSSHKLLRCDPPIVLDGGGPIIYAGALAAHPQGFLAGWMRDIVVVNQVNFDAGVSFIFSRAKLDGGSYTSAAQLALDSQGANWVAVWLQPAEDHALCMTSRDPTTNQVRVGTGGNLMAIDAALSSDGGRIAVAAQRQAVGTPFLGGEASACPSTIGALPFPSSTFGSSVVWTNAGFRYVYSGLGGQSVQTGSGRVLIGTLTDAGWPGVLSSTGQPGRNESAVSLAGDDVLVTFTADAGSANEARLFLSPPNGPAGTVKILSAQPASSSISSCGANCVVAGVVPSQPTEPVTLSFFSQAPNPQTQGTWDLTCDAPVTAFSRTTLSLATSGGRLGALVTTPSSVKLYVCDLPPGPP
jgi:hypothetical protein